MDIAGQRKLATALLSVGGTLIPLLPIGMFLGINAPLFDLFFALHIVALFWAIRVALGVIGTFCHSSDIHPFLQLLLVLPTVASLVALSLLPITARDALIHHLAVPRWWLEAGKIYSIEWHEWSFYPMLVNMGYLGFLKCDLLLLTPFYHSLFLFFSATLAGVLALRAVNSKNSGFVGFAIMLSLPLSIRTASTPLVDLGLCTFIGTAILYAFLWLEEPKRFSNSILSGIALGLALGCKYNGLLAAVCFMAALLVIAERKKINRSIIISNGSIIVLASILTFSPWWTKNLVWSGDPLYPLYQGIFPSFIETPTGEGGIPPITHRMTIYGESVLDILLTPFSMILAGKDGDPRRFDGVLSPLLLLLFYSVFKYRSLSNEGKFHAFFLTTSFLLSISFGSSRSRYLLPFIPSAIVLTTDGLSRITNITSKSRLFLTLLLLNFAWSTLYTFNLLGASGVSHLISNEHKSKFISNRIPEYGMIEFMNSNLPKNSRTYILYTSNSFFYYDVDTFSGGHFSANYLTHWLRKSSSVEDLVSLFRMNGITHVMTDTARATRTLNGVLGDREKAIWNEFNQKHLHTLRVERGFILWEIR